MHLDDILYVEQGHCLKLVLIEETLPIYWHDNHWEYLGDYN